MARSTDTDRVFSFSRFFSLIFSLFQLFVFWSCPRSCLDAFSRQLCWDDFPVRVRSGHVQNFQNFSNFRPFPLLICPLLIAACFSQVSLRVKATILRWG